jgi:hypothetical protein
VKPIPDEFVREWKSETPGSQGIAVFIRVLPPGGVGMEKTIPTGEPTGKRAQPYLDEHLADGGTAGDEMFHRLNPPKTRAG